MADLEREQLVRDSIEMLPPALPADDHAPVFRAAAPAVHAARGTARPGEGLHRLHSGPMPEAAQTNFGRQGLLMGVARSILADALDGPDRVFGAGIQPASAQADPDGSSRQVGRAAGRPSVQRNGSPHVRRYSAGGAHGAVRGMARGAAWRRGVHRRRSTRHGPRSGAEAPLCCRTRPLSEGARDVRTPGNGNRSCANAEFFAPLHDVSGPV